MVSTETPVCEFDRPAPDFNLPGVDGRHWSLADCRGPNGLLVMFICNHCPYVKHVQAGIVELAEDYTHKGISFIAINSNDVDNHPADSPQNMKLDARRLGYTFPYLFDESQEVARAYSAACTPDFYVFDEELLCVYRGQMDDSRPGNGKPVTGKHLRDALDNILSGEPVSEEQKPSIGCNIKWK